MNVDVEIDPGHAALVRFMRAASIPGALTGNGVANMSQPQTSPLRQLARAFSGELPGQNNLFADFISPDDMWAQLAVPSLIGADHLLLTKDGVSNEGISDASLFHRTHTAPCSGVLAIYSAASLVPLLRDLPAIFSTGARNLPV